MCAFLLFPLTPSFAPYIPPSPLPFLLPSLPPPSYTSVVSQVMGRCDGVFGTWDDEYDKFTGQLREMSKKKREEQALLKFSWRAVSAHKKLQDRIFRMKE